MIFINTRPKTRAKNLTAFLQSQGVNVLELPLLELVACELTQPERQYLTQLHDYSALVFVSETAVTYFFDFITTHQISLNPNLSFIAVGQKTAEIFKHAWQKITDISPKLITPSDFKLPENNEGVLQLPFIQSLNLNDKILILKGKDGRELLKNTLLEKGVTVDNVDFYQRIYPQTSTQIFQDFCQYLPQKTIVLITSLTAWRHWQNLIQDKFNPSDFMYLVLQDRIADSMVKDIQPKPLITVIEDLQPMTIFQAVLTLKESP